MKKVAKRSLSLVLAVVLTMGLVACGGGEDTKESVQKTIDDLQVKMTEVTSAYQDAFSDQEALKDPNKAVEIFGKSEQMINDAIAACDSVDAPGPDSQKYRDICKDMFTLFRDMVNELKSTDMTNEEAGKEVSEKYLTQIMAKSSEAMKFMQDLVTKYGVTLPTNTTTTGTAGTDAGTETATQ